MARRGKSKRYNDTHHRQCRSNGGTSEPDNVIEVDRQRHALWHLLFKNRLPDDVRREIDNVWLPRKEA